jgi:hypothetical protein
MKIRSFIILYKEERKMKTLKHIEVTAFCAIVLLLSIAVALTFADNPPSTPTAITLSLSTKSVTLGNNLTVSGSVTPSVSGFPPVSGVAVTLTYTKPDATTSTTTVTTSTDGSFSDTYTPDVAGSWSVTASWAGDVAYLSATSSTETFAVTNNSAGGVSMVYLYVATTIVIIAIAAIAVYLYMKKK